VGAAAGGGVGNVTETATVAVVPFLSLTVITQFPAPIAVTVNVPLLFADPETLATCALSLAADIGPPPDCVAVKLCAVPVAVNASCAGETVIDFVAALCAVIGLGISEELLPPPQPAARSAKSVTAAVLDRAVIAKPPRIDAR
jgi:hypothetical protein